MGKKKRIGFLETRIKIDWSDMDRYGHVNNVMIMKYVQAARVNFWETIGIGSGIDAQGAGANLAAVSCKFLKPLFYPGQVVIETRVNFIKTSSFGLFHRITGDNGDLAVEASDAVVLYNYNREEKIHISEKLRTSLLQFLAEEN